MRYIERVRIENFQSHADTELRLDPGFNVIVGPSDNGKTAVLRALRWVLYNEPGGTDFIRRGARECRVELTMSDGTCILRERTHRVNRYVVTVPGEEPQVFEGFGTRPPAEVVRAHGMPPVALDTDHRVLLNLGSQLEGPFLLSEPASLRAKAIGRLLGVHVVDAGARLARRDMQALGRQARQMEDDLARLDEQLAGYADLPRWEQDLQAAEARLDQAARLGERVHRLESLRARLAEVEAGVAQARGVLDGLRLLPEAESRVLRVQSALEQAARLDRLGKSWQRNEAEIKDLGRRLTAAQVLEAVEDRTVRAEGLADRQRVLAAAYDQLQKVQADLRSTGSSLAAVAAADAAGGALERAAHRMEQLGRLHKALGALQDVQGRLEQGSQYLREVSSEVARLAHDYEHLMRRQGRCPTCFSPITPEMIQRIARELTGGAVKEAEPDAG